LVLRDQNALRCSAQEMPRRWRWTERRLVPLAPRTLERLEEITAKIRSHGAVNLEPMQVAALLLERTTEQLSGDEAEELVDAALSRR